MRRVCAHVIGSFVICVPWSALPARAQIVPTFDGREVSVRFELNDADESATDENSATPSVASGLFDRAIDLTHSISGGAVLVHAEQHSEVSSGVIAVAGRTSIEVSATEAGAISLGCAASLVYIEFTLLQDSGFHLRVATEGAVTGVLRSSDFSYTEPLDNTHMATGTLAAGDYVFEVNADACHQVTDSGSEQQAARFEIALVLDNAGCDTSFDLAGFSSGTVALLVGDAGITPDGALRLTENLSGQAGAAWRPGKVSVAGGFDTTFQFRISDGSADGLAFLVQNDGPFAIGTGGSGLGYGDFGQGGIAKSIAVEFDTFAFGNEFSSNHVSVQTRGVEVNSPLDAHSLGHAVLETAVTDGEAHVCRVIYLPGQLSVYLDGGLVLQVPVDLENIAGASILDDSGCAWLGFTGGSGAATAAQDILAWTLGGECDESSHYADFSDTTGLTLLGNAAVHNADILRLTEDAGDQKSAVWRNRRMHVGDGFITQFAFRISPSGVPADGFAFVVQNEGPDALGGGGHGIGYGGTDVPGITRSVAVEFDTFPGMDISVQTRGNEPNDSDDAYALGQSFPDGLADGAIHLCRIVYAPGLLDIYLDGSETPELSVVLDLRDINGHNVLGASGCAYVGFTAATGGFSSSHEILNWSIGPNCAAAPRPGDFDDDCDVDLDDVAALQACASGAAVQAPSGCEEMDLDHDTDVDMDDFGALQRCFSGSGNPADPSCAQ